MSRTFLAVTAGLLVMLSASFAQAAVLPFVPDSTGAAAPLFDPDSGTLLSPATGGNVTVLASETLSIDTTTGAISKNGSDAFSGSGDIGNTAAGDNGYAEITLFTFNNLLVHRGANISITGNRAAGLLARNIIAVDGTVSATGKDAGSGNGSAGAGTLAGYAGGAGIQDPALGSAGLPGGGLTGFGGAAGTGSSGGGGGGLTYTDARLADLRGGGGGGSGAAYTPLPPLFSTSGGGGGGGGGLLLLAQQGLVLGPNAAILAKGGAGGTGFITDSNNGNAGGGGGGAGGSVVLCAPGIIVNSGSQINLAGGTPGTGRNAANGTAGETGRLAIYSKSPLANSGATITATRFDNATSAYPAALDTSLPHAGVLNYLNDNNATATPLFDPDNGTLLSPATSGNVTVLSGETLSINTSTSVISKSGANPFYSLGDTGTTESGANGSKEIALFTFQNLTVNNGAIINITGSKALGFIARNSMTIHGTVNVSGMPGTLGTAGPGGYAGGSASRATTGFPGGGITGFGGTAGVFSNGSGGGGGGGRTYTDARLTDLLGGSGGGSGAAVQGSFEMFSGGGGGGGGGLLLLAQNTLTLGPTGTILAKGGAGDNGSGIPAEGGAGGGGGGAGGSVVLCAPSVALNIGSQINTAGGTFGTGINMPSGTAGQNGRLAIYSSATPVASGAVITATRFDNTLAAYPAALTPAGEPPPVMVSFTMEKSNQSGGYIANLTGKGTPGARYDFQRSTDLTTWTQDGSPRTAGTDGLMTVVRTANSVTTPKLYWRFKKL